MVMMALGTICIPYSRKLSREKTFAKIRFSRRKQIARFAAPKVPCSQILRRKLSRIATKLRKFSPSKVSRYTVLQSDCHAESTWIYTCTHSKSCVHVHGSTLHTSSETSPGLCNRDALMYWNTSVMASTFILSS